MTRTTKYWDSCSWSVKVLWMSDYIGITVIQGMFCCFSTVTR